MANVKTVVVLLLGFVLLGGAVLTPIMGLGEWLDGSALHLRSHPSNSSVIHSIGILINFSGGIWYGKIKFSPPSLKAAAHASANHASDDESEKLLPTKARPGSGRSEGGGQGDAQLHLSHGHHR